MIHARIRALAPGARAALAVYLLVLATATHWPKLQIDAPIQRPDLILHFGAFCVLTVLCLFAQLGGPLKSAPNLVIGAGLSAAYATIDELTQGFPALHRHVNVSDWLANLGGVAIGVGVVLLVPLGGGAPERR